MRRNRVGTPPNVFRSVNRTNARALLVLQGRRAEKTKMNVNRSPVDMESVIIPMEATRKSLTYNIIKIH